MRSMALRAAPILALMTAFALIACAAPQSASAAQDHPYTIAEPPDGAVQYVRYAVDDSVAYGVLDGETVRELEGPPFDDPAETGATHPLGDVRLLAPVEPRVILAAARNFASHLDGRPAPEKPELFTLLPGSIVGPEDGIVYPPDAEDLHYEAELVVVIGRSAKDVSVEEAEEVIFGVTAGNDVTERGWQDSDIQWLRGKASDTFAPMGPVLTRGLDYGNLHLEGRLNGEVVQSENSSDLLFDIPTIVSFVSRYIALEPGDAIYTGTMQTTSAMEPGDVFEVEVEGVGVLRNRVVTPEEAAAAAP